MVAFSVFTSFILGLMGAAALQAARRAGNGRQDEPMALPARLGWRLAWLAAWACALYLLVDSAGWLKAVFVWLAVMSLAGGTVVFAAGWRTRR